MADMSIELADPHGKGLKKVPEYIAQGPAREDHGKAYKEIFRKLQIRHEAHEDFFEDNLKPQRNKSKHQKLLVKGDVDSIQKLSDSVLTALGYIVWADKRGWLLGSDELSEGEEPLRYIRPIERKPGDHDRFYPILEALWKKMRGLIFEIKPTAVHRNPLDPISADERPRSCKDSPVGRQLLRTNIAGKVPVTPVQLTGMVLDQPVRGLNLKPETQLQSAQRVDFDPLLNGETAPLGQWCASRIETVVISTINALREARSNSHPEVFQRLWMAHVARLEEIEHAEEQELHRNPSRSESRNDQSRRPSHTTNIDENSKTTSAYQDAEEDVTMEDADTSLDNSSIDESQHGQATPLRRTSIASLTTNTKTADTTYEQGLANEPISSPDVTADQTATTKKKVDTITTPTILTHRITNDQAVHERHYPPPSSIPPFTSHASTITTQRPTFPISSYIQPTLPSTISTHITPFKSSQVIPTGQPYHWPDAPVLPTTYPAFRAGVRLRANVPDTIANEKLILVFSYGWNDFCRVVKHEEDWKIWFMGDLRRAAEREGVMVWRMRVVCVVAEARG